MKHKTDFRGLRARRERALARPELRLEPKPRPVPAAEIEAAIAAGRFQRLPEVRRK